MTANAPSRSDLFACLPWYDLSELRRATDALWRRIAAELRRARIDQVPGTLNRTLPYQDQWASGALLFGQACGYDVALSYAHQLQPVATPCYTCHGCDGPMYRSFIVVREDDPAVSIADLRGRRCVINTATSHSGMGVLRALVAPLAHIGRFFGQVITSGAHETSLALIRAAQADVAAIDCVTYALLQRVRPGLLAGTRVIQHTVPMPAPPFVTGARTSPAMLTTLRAALRAAVADPEIAAPLALDGVVELTRDAYQPMIALKRGADQLGYMELPPR